MKIKELIEKLSTYDPELEVVLPGHSDSDGYSGSNDVQPIELRPERSWRGDYEGRASWNKHATDFRQMVLID